MNKFAKSPISGWICKMFRVDRLYNWNRLCWESYIKSTVAEDRAEGEGELSSCDDLVSNFDTC